MAWTPEDLRAWRARLRWTQARAADSLCYHLFAYKKLEGGTRHIVPRLRRMCELVERDHLRSLYSASSEGGTLQRFATADAVVAYHEALERDGKLLSADGRRRIRHVALFAGMGGAAAGFERIGSDAVLLACSDISPGANALHRHRWPDAPRLGNVQDVEWAKLRGLVDLVTFGPPCQSFSNAGKRRGLDDPRGCMVMESLRAIGAMQPKWIVFENVEGFLSFTQAFEEFRDAAEELGYKIAWRVLDARAFGLPQSRSRVWIVGELGADTRGPRAVLDLRESPNRIKIARGEGWRNPPRRFEGGAGDLTLSEPDWEDPWSWSGPGPGRVPDAEPAPAPEPGTVLAVSFRNYDVKDHAPCVQTKGNSLNSVPVFLIRDANGSWTPRVTTPLERQRLQGYDDGWLDGPTLRGQPFSDAERSRLIGNAWAVPMVAWILAGIEYLFHTERPEIHLDYRRLLRPFGKLPPRLAKSEPVAVFSWAPGAMPTNDGKRSTGAIAKLIGDRVKLRYELAR